MLYDFERFWNVFEKFFEIQSNFHWVLEKFDLEKDIELDWVQHFLGSNFFKP